MDEKVPLLTVGLPVHNGEDYLEEALDSLLTQTLTDFELVVSDNASTDGTQSICLYYAGRDQRIRYLRSEVNYGGAWNFNNVFLNSRGKYFKFAAHDDVCEPTFLERCSEMLEHAPAAVVLCHPRPVRIDGEGREVKSFPDHLDLRQDSPHERLRAYLRSFGHANPLFGVVRARTLAGTGLLGRYDSADMVLLAELAIRGQLWGIDEPLFKRRIHAQASRKANRTPTEVTRWFDPNQRHRRTFRRNRMYAELVRAVVRAPLLREERVRCLRVLTTTWFSRFGAQMAWELSSAMIPEHTSARLYRSVQRRRGTRA